MSSDYCPSRHRTVRRLTRVVNVGGVAVGGLNPIRLQSMTTSDTEDVAATLAQAIRLAEAGCEIIRITAPNKAAAIALKDIHRQFRAAGFNQPLVADIHFLPVAAMEAVEHVEKVRVNPGNYADKKKFAVLEYTDKAYAEELERLHEAFTPLVLRAKALGRCLRIGTNHGSLSDRIMNRWGDTPRGMVESALEFVRIAESAGFKDLIISMKSSNPKVMVEAYRLLVATLDTHGEPYPLHLGVTEAGDGEDGRIKSAAGIGALLEDGLGDTIRVSLTEPPEFEIPVAQALVARYANWPATTAPAGAPADPTDPYQFRRRQAEIIRADGDIPVGGTLIPRVFGPAGAPGPVGREPAADVIVGTLPSAERQLGKDVATGSAELQLGPSSSAAPLLLDLGHDPLATLTKTITALPSATLLGLDNTGSLGETRAYRLLAAVIEANFQAAESLAPGSGIRHPIIIALPRQQDDLAIAAIAGGLLIDGIGDALYLPAAQDPRRLTFTLLQAVKARVTRADYVACPSCGRTQFDLMEVTAHIKEVTNHLDGVTIAIMGCIVNGPGEMADADFGYVGSGPGKIDLYRRKDKVRSGIPQATARDELVKLIHEHGLWREPGT